MSICHREYRRKTARSLDWIEPNAWKAILESWTADFKALHEPHQQVISLQ